MMNWDLRNYNYRADGIYADKDDAMIFDLKTARKSLLVQMANVYRNRAIGHCLQKNGAYVITNVRWGDERSYSTEFLLENGEKVCLTEKFAFLGAPKKSIISIGTYGCVQSKENKCYFREGLEAMLDELTPEIVLVYGSTPKKIFSADIMCKTNFVHYPNWTSQVRKKVG